MVISRRFSLNEGRHVIDILDPTNTWRVCWYDCDPEDESQLRESILYQRLNDLLDKLIDSTKTLPSGKVYQAYEQRFVSHAVFCAIKASQLNSFQPIMSIQHRFGGILKREMKWVMDFTSLSLFRDDVERLLRDLYGDIKSEALDSVLRAVFVIVEEFTRYVRNDLWKEHSDAVSIDVSRGIGISHGYGFSGSDYRQGLAAQFDLIVRACEVGANPSAFSEYTVQFARLFGEHWEIPNNPLEFLSLSDEMKWAWFNRDRAVSRVAQ
jgi:hypothetical protein